MAVDWQGAFDRSLIDVLSSRKCEGASAARPSDALFVRGEQHGVVGVLLERWPVASDVRDVARQLEHQAHLDLLGQIDDVLVRARLRAVVLKGAGLAERLYPRPWLRPTSDVDLLVREADLEAARDALSAVGYVWEDTAVEARYRRQHHHIHLRRSGSLPLELHFHAYRGFGRVMASEPLLARSVAFRGRHPESGVRQWQALRALSPPDEFVYLAVHAAAHRFVRLGWLYDLELLLDTMGREDIAAARSLAMVSGFFRATSLAAELLVALLGVDPARLVGLRGLGRSREAVLCRVLAEPASPLLRSATRFVFTSSLCDSPVAAIRYAHRGARDHLARILGASPHA